MARQVYDYNYEIFISAARIYKQTYLLAREIKQISVINTAEIGPRGGRRTDGQAYRTAEFRPPANLKLYTHIHNTHTPIHT